VRGGQEAASPPLFPVARRNARRGRNPGRTPGKLINPAFDSQQEAEKLHEFTIRKPSHFQGIARPWQHMRYSSPEKCLRLVPDRTLDKPYPVQAKGTFHADDTPVLIPAEARN
jgi:hypothetical protein